MHAISDDGIHWEREGVPCVASHPGRMPDQPFPLLELDGVYHLWFCHRLGRDFAIKQVATALAMPLRPTLSTGHGKTKPACWNPHRVAGIPIWFILLMFSPITTSYGCYIAATTLTTASASAMPTTVIDQANSANDMTPLTPQASHWGEFYGNRYRASAGRYPTEWVVRTLAGATILA